MSNPFDGSSGTSGMAELGIIGNPVGPLDDVRKHGFDPRNVASCAPPSPGVRGCPVWQACRFHIRKNGGFKGEGPRNVGYFLETAGRRKEDEISCFRFTSSLQGRMDFGAINRQNGLDGERIAIIAQEGEIIHRKVTLRTNPEAPPEFAQFKAQIIEAPVGRFPRLGETPASTYDQMLAERQRAREQGDPDLETGPPERLTTLDESDSWEAPAGDPPLDGPIATATPVSEPVKKGKGA